MPILKKVVDCIQNFVAERFLQARLEIRPLDRLGLHILRHDSSDHPIPVAQLNRFPLAQQRLQLPGVP